jgi:hypothetical protein
MPYCGTRIALIVLQDVLLPDASLGLDFESIKFVAQLGKISHWRGQIAGRCLDQVCRNQRMFSIIKSNENNEETSPSSVSIKIADRRLPFRG